MTLRDRWRATQKWVAYKLGYRRFGYINLVPPDDLIHEVAPGQYVRPGGNVHGEFVFKMTLRARLLLLWSGKVQFVFVVWTEQEPKRLGHFVDLAVNPRRNYGS